MLEYVKYVIFYINVLYIICYNMLQYVRICYNMLEFVTICYNML